MNEGPVDADRRAPPSGNPGPHIAEDNPAAAYRVAQTIRMHLDMLNRHPFSGRPGRVEGTRELVIPNLPYIVAYAVDGNRVAILAVLHQTRKWPRTFGEAFKV